MTISPLSNAGELGYPKGSLLSSGAVSQDSEVHCSEAVVLGLYDGTLEPTGVTQ